MSTIKAIIVDDEPSAIETLRGMLGAFCPNVVIEAEATNLEDALLAIQKHPPELIFLDIELPPWGKGFDLLKLTPYYHFGIIFTTAYSDYAIQAINDVQPWGYLVKPYRVADLVKAVLTAETKLSVQPGGITEPADSHGIIVPDGRKGNIVVHAKDILYCHTNGGTTDIFTVRADKLEKVVASRSLKELEDLLPPHLFCRTHHSYLVNLQHVVRYQHTGRNGVIYLPHNQQVAISVQKMDAFEAQFKSFLKGRS